MCVEQYCRSIALRICKSQCHTQHFYVAMMDEFALELLGTAGHLFSNSTNSSSQSYNRNFLRTLNSENMFLKSVLELAVSLALRLTSVPACRDALRAETKIKYIVMSFFAFLPDTRVSPKSLSKFKLATCSSAGTFW